MKNSGNVKLQHETGICDTINETELKRSNNRTTDKIFQLEFHNGNFGKAAQNVYLFVDIKISAFIFLFSMTIFVQVPYCN